MSCNGCRVLRKGCSDDCMLRHCLTWIESPEAQANATVFVAKFFGRATLMSFLSSVPPNQTPALFESLMYEAVGRTINPVNGAVGLLSTGKWQLCQLGVQKVLLGGALTSLPQLLDEITTHDKCFHSILAPSSNSVHHQSIQSGLLMMERCHCHQVKKTQSEESESSTLESTQTERDQILTLFL